MAILNFYITRHGETIGNTDRILYHPKDDVLNDQGKRMAKLLGLSLQGVKFDEVYCSTYPRTLETAEIILKHNVKDAAVKPQTDSRLREIGFEDCYGKPYGHMIKGIVDFLATGKPDEDFKFGESESIPSVQERAKSFVQDIISKHEVSQEEATLLIVSHGALIRFMMQVFANPEHFIVNGWHDEALKVAKNTALMKVRVKCQASEKPNVTFEKIQDISHLPDDILEKDSLKKIVNTPEGKHLSHCFHV